MLGEPEELASCFVPLPSRATVIALLDSTVSATAHHENGAVGALSLTERLSAKRCAR